MLAAEAHQHLGVGAGRRLLDSLGLQPVTVLLTQPLSNAAAALVVLPIAVHVAIAQGVNPRAYAMTVSIAASCSFLTPLEPACALVYNPGKYRVLDFLRAGIGLTAVVFVIAMILIPILWPL